MPKESIKTYDRVKALEYADRWALKRNPEYLDYSNLGGDCTNFCSQALFAGGCRMNFEQYGWFYINGNVKSPSWTGVTYLYKFLIDNNDTGPFGVEVNVKDLMIGDIIQINFENDKVFNHSVLVVEIGTPKDISNIFISTHTDDRQRYSLINYNWTNIRFLHILGHR